MWTGWAAVVTRTFWKNYAYSLIAMDPPLWKFLSLPVSCVALLVIEYWEREHRLLAWFDAQPRWLRWGAYYALIVWICCFGSFKQRTFIYFQF